MGKNRTCGYRNIVYDQRNKKIVLFTWNDEGERVVEYHDYEPHLYIEHKQGKDGKSIFNTPLLKKEFRTEFKRRNFVEGSGLRRIFANHQPPQQFLLQEYFGMSTDDMNKHPLRVFYLDIEVFSPDTFPTASEAKFPINLLTIYDSLTSKYHSFGLYPYTPKNDNVIYYHCKTEEKLLMAFLKYWRKNFPDILTSWNGDSFDIPYIVNRITQLFGEQYASKLSPTNKIFSMDKRDRFNNPVKEWNIRGISCIDYMKAYKKFSVNDRESYKLDYIGTFEGVGGKNAYEGSLADLSVSDWTAFVDYNIQDVNLIVKLEEKLHYLELCRMISYKALTPFEKALGTNNVVEGLMAIGAKKHDKIIPTFKNTRGVKPPGGLVREPKAGIIPDVVSFDAASLYPSTIVSLNLSPETKVGKFNIEDGVATVVTVSGKEAKLKEKDFYKFVKDKELSMSMHNILFSQKKRGILPEIIIDLYSERVDAKKKMKEHNIKSKDKKLSQEDRAWHKKKYMDYYILQYTIKILMNSIYGTFGNVHSVLYDLEMSASITLTGQESNRQAVKGVMTYIEEKYGITDDIIVMGDTDSIYLTLTPLLDKIGVPLLDAPLTKGQYPKFNPRAMELIRELGGEDDPKKGVISAHLDRWAREELNMFDPRFEFKREKICNSGLFLNAKKKYILQVLNDEGVPVETGSEKEFSHTGGELASSTISDEVRDIIKRVVIDMLMYKSNSHTNNLITELYDEYSHLDPDIIAVRKAVKNLVVPPKSYGFLQIPKGTPQNSKASIYYNQLISKYGLGKKYEAIRSGDKIRICYVLKNKYNLEYVAFKNKFPSETTLHVDYRKMFMKQVYSPLERMFEAVGWVLNDPSKQYLFDFDELI